MGWGRERFRWYSDGGMFGEMDRGGVLTYGKRRSFCVLSILKFACAFEQVNQVSPFHLLVSSKKKTLIRWCNVSPLDPVGIWCQNDVISTSVRNHVASTLIRRHFHVMCPLGLFMHNMGEIVGHQLLTE